MLVVELTSEEKEYLAEAIFLPLRLKNLLSQARPQGSMYVVELLSDQAEEIRDLCGEALEFSGFDEEYELTPEGKILERLIDKFFIG